MGAGAAVAAGIVGVLAVVLLVGLLGRRSRPPEQIIDLRDGHLAHDPVISARAEAAGATDVVIRRVVVGENGHAIDRQRPTFDSTTSGLSVGPSLRVRHRIDEVLARTGLPAQATTLLIVSTGRGTGGGGDAGVGLVAFASADDSARPFRDWFAIETGALVEVPVAATMDLGGVIDLVADAVGSETRRAGPIVAEGRVLPRPADRLLGIGQALAAALAEARWLDDEDALNDAMACVGVVAPFVEASGEAGVQLVVAAMSDHRASGVKVARNVALSAVHEMVADLPRSG